MFGWVGGLCVCVTRGWEELLLFLFVCLVLWPCVREGRGWGLRCLDDAGDAKEAPCLLASGKALGGGRVGSEATGMEKDGPYKWWPIL